MSLETLGRYEILSELGKGAMGVVYLGRDPLIGRQLALKTFRLGYSAGDEELEQFRVRFLREAQSAGILTHPNIVTIHDVAVDPGGDFFIAMEYVKGTDLKILMQRQRLDPRFAMEVVAQIAEGLGYAHSKGVVHRDIKPANIIITAEKQAKITDFGIARVETSNLTMEGQLLGTPNYMSPEQIQGLEVDHRADIFSLGVMLYELLTGKKPFFGENLTAVTHRIVYGDFTPLDDIVPGLPPAVTEVLNRALAKDPAERYDRGGEMAEDLRAILDPPAAPAQAKSANRTSSFLANPQALSAPPSGPASPQDASQAPPAPPHPAAAPFPPGQNVAAPPGAPPAGAAPPSGVLPSGAPPSGAPPSGVLPSGVLPSGGLQPGVPQAGAAQAGAAPPVAGHPDATLVTSQPSASHPTVATGVSSTATAVATAPSTTGGETFLGRPSTGRMALVAAVALALSLVGLGIARLTVKEETSAPRVDPELQRQVQFLPFLKQGRELLEAGEPAAAIEAFERAAGIAPDNREIRRWRDRAEQELLESDGVELEAAYVTERLRAGRSSLRRRDFSGAIRLAEEVLAVDPENRDGKDLLRQANEGQRRREQALARPRNQPPPPPVQAPAAAPPAATVTEETAPAPAADGTLVVEFVSEVSEGRLTIFNGQEKLYQQQFEFVTGKTGFLRRARKTSGSLRQNLTLPSGDLDLRIYVWRKGAQTKTAEIKGNLPPGSSRVLHIEVSKEGRVSVRLE